jgi:hypothetical protein
MTSEALLQDRNDISPSSRDEPLPKSEWQYWLVQDNQLVVGHFVRNGYLGHTVVSISDLPNDFVTAEDLEALGISLSRLKDRGPVFKLHLRPDLSPG